MPKQEEKKKFIISINIMARHLNNQTPLRRYYRYKDTFDELQAILHSKPLTTLTSSIALPKAEYSSWSAYMRLFLHIYYCMINMSHVQLVKIQFSLTQY